MTGGASPATGGRAGGPLLTFDCYGTLIDWRAGIVEGLRDAWPVAGEVPSETLLSGFLSIQDELKTSAYRPYRELLSETALRLARRQGWEATAERAARVPESLPGWRPFPDTVGALRRLHGAGMTLGILSNIDDDLLAGTLEHLEVPFGLLGTAQRLRSYKPASAHFELGRSWAGAHDAWLHVAQSLFHDVLPATRLGVPILWVNREGEALPADAEPVHVAGDLAEAADWILARYGDTQANGRT